MAKQIKQSIQDRTSALLNERFCKVVDVHFSEDYYRFISQGTDVAINDFGPERVEVRVTPWIGDYWFYIHIKFSPDIKNKTVIFASISFFQKTDEEIKQLFRAEWDSYQIIEGYNHPQPHWHFTAHLSDKTTFSDLENIEEEGEYNKLLGNSKTINLDKMHFAMSGDWFSNGQMINKIDDEAVLVDWMINLFTHVREELLYKDK